MFLTAALSEKKPITNNKKLGVFTQEILQDKIFFPLINDQKWGPGNQNQPKQHIRKKCKKYDMRMWSGGPKKYRKIPSDNSAEFAKAYKQTNHLFVWERRSKNGPYRLIIQ